MFVKLKLKLKQNIIRCVFRGRRDNNNFQINCVYEIDVIEFLSFVFETKKKCVLTAVIYFYLPMCNIYYIMYLPIGFMLFKYCSRKKNYFKSIKFFFLNTTFYSLHIISDIYYKSCSSLVIASTELFLIS